MSNSEIIIPPGYLQRANGDLVKEDNLTNQEREEDQLVKALFPEAAELYLKMAAFKFKALNQVEETVTRLIKEHGIKRLEKIKGNISFVTVDGMFKVERAINDKIEVNSHIEGARQLFDQYVKVIEQQSGNDAKVFIKAAFRMDRKQFNVGKLIDLCNKDIDHPMYRQAVDALRQALHVSSSKAYLRFYKRNKTDDGWDAVPLQFSAIPAIDPEATEAPGDAESDAA